MIKYVSEDIINMYIFFYPAQMILFILFPLSQSGQHTLFKRVIFIIEL